MLTRITKYKLYVCEFGWGRATGGAYSVSRLIENALIGNLSLSQRYCVAK